VCGGRPVPGIIGLPGVLNRYWDEAEADLQRVYGIDLSDLWRGRLSFRRIAVLLRGLPAGSCLGRAAGGSAAWSDETAAILYGLWRVESRIVSTIPGAKRRDFPSPPEPPEPGWQDRIREKAEREKAKARNWLARHPELGLSV